MKKSLCNLLLGLLVLGEASASEVMSIDGRQLELKAQARACYLGFIELYDVDYYRETAPGAGSCIRLSYLREIDAATLGEATREVFEERHGEATAKRHATELQQVAEAYRSVVPGDQYLYCLDAAGSGSLLRDDVPTLELRSADFARRFLQIWVRAADRPQEPQWGFNNC